MGGVFGGGGKEAANEAKKQRAEARKIRQDANEGEARARQRAERGGIRSRGRDLLIGNLSKANLSPVVGG